MFLSKMPPTDQKTQFISERLRLSLSISELCTNYGIGRKIGNKWIDRCLHHRHRRGINGSKRTFEPPFILLISLNPTMAIE
jgi:hypothetical protein